MPVAIDGLQILGHQGGQRGRSVGRRVALAGDPLAQQLTEPQPDVREDVVLGHQLADLFDDLGDLCLSHRCSVGVGDPVRQQ
jgi:hypothetical protein